MLQHSQVPVVTYLPLIEQWCNNYATVSVDVAMTVSRSCAQQFTLIFCSTSLIWSTSFDVYKYVIKVTNFEAGSSGQDCNKPQFFSSFALREQPVERKQVVSVLVKKWITKILEMTDSFVTPLRAMLQINVEIAARKVTEEESTILLLRHCAKHDKSNKSANSHVAKFRHCACNKQSSISRTVHFNPQSFIILDFSLFLF